MRCCAVSSCQSGIFIERSPHTYSLLHLLQSQKLTGHFIALALTRTCHDFDDDLPRAVLVVVPSVHFRVSPFIKFRVVSPKALCVWCWGRVGGLHEGLRGADAVVHVSLRAGVSMYGVSSIFQ